MSHPLVLYKPQGLSLSSQSPYFRPNHLVVLNSSFSMPFLFWGPPNWTSCCRCGLVSAEQRGVITSFSNCAPIYSVQGAVGLLCCQWLICSLLSARTPGPFPESCSPASQSSTCVIARFSSFPGTGFLLVHAEFGFLLVHAEFDKIHLSTFLQPVWVSLYVNGLLQT